MKTHILFLALLISGLSLAQTGFNYKAVVKDESGNLLVEQTIAVGFTITNDDDSSDFYSELHNPVTTDDNGFFIVNVGEGVPLDVAFDSLDWSSGNYTLTTEISIDGGLDFIDLGDTPFKAVPYAKTTEKITSAPSRTLEISGDGQQKIRINSTDNNIPALEFMKTGSGTDWKIQNSNNWLDIMTSDNDFANTNIKFSFHKDGRLGINNSNPAEELHVTGTIRSSDLSGSGIRKVYADNLGNLTTSDTETKYLTLGPGAFVSTDPNAYNNGTTLNGTGGSGVYARYFANVSLPQGATITKFECHFIDDSSSNLTARMFRSPHTSTVKFNEDELQSTGTLGSFRSLSTTVITVGTIDNLNNIYGVELVSNGWHFSDMLVTGVIISYVLN